MTAQDAPPPVEKEVKPDGVAPKPKKALSSADMRRFDPYNPHRRPGQFTMGKANPTRDAAILVAALAFIFFLSWVNQDAVSDTDTEKPKLDTLAKIRQVKRETRRYAHKLYTGRYPARWDCDLFVAGSSIPGCGFGTYAGKNYTAGDVVASELGPEIRGLRAYEYLVKHHPVLNNVVMGEGSASFVASRNIAAGEELFLSYKDHPASKVESKAFRSIPTLAEYALADEIIQTERSRLDARVRVIKSRHPEVRRAVNLAKAVTARFHPTVANLLPSDVRDLESYSEKGKHSDAPHMNSVLKALKNHTHATISEHGQCAEAGKTARGDALLPVPLLAVVRAGTCSDDAETCSAEASEGCFDREDSSLILCPLWKGGVRMVTDQATTNAKFQWNEYNLDNVAAKDKDVESIEEMFPVSLSWDLIALREVEPGEEIVVAVQRNPQTGRYRIPDSLFHKMWKDR